MNTVTKSNNVVVESAGTEVEAGAAVIEMLRRFHYGEPAAAASTTKPAGAVLPALLNPYRDASAIRYQYPLYLIPPDGATGSALARPVSEYLSESLDALGAEDARILKDNLPWLERYLRQTLDGPDPVDAPGLFAEAAAALQKQLDLDQSSRDKLDADLEKLKGSIAADGQFIGYGPRVSLHLMVHAIRHRRNHRREQFRQQVDKHIQGLQSLLEIEKSKSADANEPASVESSVGPGSRHLDTSALSGMLERRVHGSVEMPVERRVRIELALQDLLDWEDDPVLVRFVGQLDDPWFSKQSSLELVDSNDPCKTASEVFDRYAAGFARLFAASRVAALEIDGAYNSGVHDSWFANFDWQAFSN
ncbi:MAG: hypothetical protein KAJ57_11930, partial [Woeseiaceae bacterium]|nr:hypothetical protein [Woeseiaceae bacterium]